MQYTQLSRRSAGVKSSDIDWEKQYLTFIPVQDAVFRWAERATSGHLEYSTDEGQTWTTISKNGNTPSIQAGTKVMWKGNLEPDTSSYGDGGIGSFSSTGLYNVMGNTMSLLYGDNYIGQTTLVKSYTFYQLFLNNMVVDCKNMILPATSLTKRCYSSMFYGCTRLIAAPELPAKTLIDYCYSYMFWGCTSITTTPDLPATTLAAYCCKNMFTGCTSLTTVPSILPATVLAQYCYTAMFYGCTNLTKAPELPAKTLINYCYQLMFCECTKLNYIKCLATNISASECLSDWVMSVASTGTFVKAVGMTGWSTGTSGTPSGWTVVDDNS